MIDMTLLVYGTLKKEFHNSRFCENAVSIEKGTVCGKLYQLPPGFPALQVPIETVLWQGTKDVFADAQNQYIENDIMDFKFKAYEGWDIVHGELVTFAEPDDLIAIDELEGRPFFYDRVLVPVKTEGGSVAAAYVYIMDDIHFSARYLPGGIWPENRKTKIIKGVEKCAMTN